MAVDFDTEIQYLKGIGEKRAALLRKLEIRTVGDLVHHYPRDYIDLSAPLPPQRQPSGIQPPSGQR